MIGFGNPLMLVLMPPAILLLLHMHRVYPRIYSRIVKVYHPIVRLVDRRGGETKRLTSLFLKTAAVTLLVLALAEPFYTHTVVVEVSGKTMTEIRLKVNPVVVIALDVSGSMGGAKLWQAVDAVSEFLDKLRLNVDVGFVAFAHTVVAALPPSNETRCKIREVLHGLTAGGGTMFTAPLTTILTWGRLYREFNVTFIVVFVTDGLPADPLETMELLKKYRELNIPVYTVFVGSDPAGIKITQEMAKATGARAYRASSVDELAKTLARVAHDVTEVIREKVEVRKKIVRFVREPLTPYLVITSLALVTVYRFYRLSRQGIAA